MTSFKINFCISGLPETWITPTRRDFLCFFGVVLLCITQIPHPPQLFSWMLPNNFAAKLQKCFTDYEASPSCPSAASRRLQFFISGLNIFFQHQRPWSELHRLLSRFQTEEKKKKNVSEGLVKCLSQAWHGSFILISVCEFDVYKKNWTCRINMQRGKCNKTLERRRLNKQHYHGRRHLEEDLRSSQLQSPFSSSPSFPLFSIFPND